MLNKAKSLARSWPAATLTWVDQPLDLLGFQADLRFPSSSLENQRKWPAASDCGPAAMTCPVDFQGVGAGSGKGEAFKSPPDQHLRGRAASAGDESGA